MLNLVEWKKSFESRSVSEYGGKCPFEGVHYVVSVTRRLSRGKV